MIKISNCNLYAKKSYGTLSKGAIFLAILVYLSANILQALKNVGGVMQYFLPNSVFDAIKKGSGG